MFVVIDNSSKHIWCALLKIKNGETMKSDFLKHLSTSKRSPVRIEADRGANFYYSISKNIVKVKIIHHCSRFTDRRPSIAARVNRTKRNSLKKPVFLAENAYWINELPSFIHQKKTIQSTAPQK